MNLSHEEHITNLRHTIRVAKRAISLGKHPFGAILVDEANNIIGEQGNIDTLNHAEISLLRTAYTNYSPSYLQKCTLYTSFEPCCMCAGSCYWSGIGSVVFGQTEKRLLELTGKNVENPTMSLSCRAVFEAGQRKVNVLGPFPELEQEIITDHIHFWNT